MTLSEQIRERKLTLLKYVNVVKERAEHEPTGNIRIVKQNNCDFFYLVPCGNKTRAEYIPKENKELISSLLQKRYDKLVLKAINKELKAIAGFEKEFNEKSLGELFEKIDRNCRQYIKAFEYSDEVYAEMWQSKKYVGNPYPFENSEFITSRNEKVRSKSELIIANYLNEEHIPYRYEYPVVLSNKMKIYPDFLILNKETREEVIWEHFGKMDNPEYRKRAFDKIEQLTISGIVPKKGLIVTYEDYSNPLNIKMVRNLINAYFHR